MEKEQWILKQTEQVNSVINSTFLSEDQRTQLKMIPSKHRNKTLIIPLKSLLSIAAGIALLVTINIYSIQKTTVSENQHEQLYTAYFDYLTELV